MSDKPAIRRSMEYRIKKRPVLEPEPATLNPPNHTVCVAGNGYGWTRPSFVEKEQQVVNQLRKHMTPRITKKIGKAFNKVRYANCSHVKKLQYKMELVEQVKELEHRRDAEEAERQMKVLLQAGAVQCKSRERASKKEAAHEEGMHTGGGHAPKRCSLMPEFMIMYEYKRDTLGRPHIKPIAAMKLP